MFLPTVALFFPLAMNTGPQVPFYADAGVVAMMFVAPVSVSYTHLTLPTSDLV